MKDPEVKSFIDVVKRLLNSLIYYTSYVVFCVVLSLFITSLLQTFV